MLKEHGSKNVKLKQKVKKAMFNNSACIRNPKKAMFKNFACIRNPKKAMFKNFACIRNPKKAMFKNLACIRNPKKGMARRRGFSNEFWLAIFLAFICLNEQLMSFVL